MKRPKRRGRKVRTRQHVANSHEPKHRHSGPDTPIPDKLPGHPARCVRLSEPNPRPYSQSLLEHAQTQWQFGDWDTLCRITSDSLLSHPDRAKLALLAATAHFHYGNASAVRHFVALAQQWGCDQKHIAQMLVAGVHNTLGRAAAARGEERRALTHFQAAIATGSPTGDARLITKARSIHQLEELALPAAYRPGAFLPPLQAEPTVTTPARPDTAPTPRSITVRQLAFHRLGEMPAPDTLNASLPCCASMLTSGHRQVVAFFVEDRMLRIVQRDLPSDTLHVFDLPTRDRGHHAQQRIDLAIDRAGYFHVTYGADGEHHVHRRSTAPFNITGWTEELELPDAGQRPITAPCFLSPRVSASQHPLMLFYQGGGPEHDAVHVIAYDESTEQWIDRPTALLSNAVPRQQCGHVYWSRPATGTDGALHLAFWTRSDRSPNPDLGDRIHVCYATSPDDGFHWYTSAGLPYRLPITSTNAEIVFTAALGCTITDEPSITLDSQNHPHITFCTEDPEGRQQHHHSWLDRGIWRHYLAPPLPISVARHPNQMQTRPRTRPAIFIDGDDTAYVIYDRPVPAGGQCVAALTPPDYHFQPDLVQTIYDSNVQLNILFIDRTRWNQDGVFSMLVRLPAKSDDDRLDPRALSLILVDLQL